MADVRDLMRRVDARIYHSRVVRAVARFGTSEITGAYFQKPREVILPGGGVQTVGLSFECQHVPAIADLIEGDEISIDDYGTFRFLHELLPGGDESGRTIMVLGEQLNQ
jgi:hypothetical protein